jgi:hypothetical protein
MQKQRLVWISGQSGAGKTSLCNTLAAELGWLHFDGDIFAHGGDALAVTGIPDAEMVAKEQGSERKRHYGSRPLSHVCGGPVFTSSLGSVLTS